MNGRQPAPSMHSSRRPSIIGPLALIALGIVALLVTVGKLSVFELWEWYVRWWPLLLIAIGAISLVEWWLDRGSPYRRQSHYGGIVTLVILLALIAYAHHGLKGVGGVFDNDDDLMFHVFGQQHESEFNLNQQIPAAAFLTIHAARGDVTVMPSGDSQLHVQAHMEAYAGNDREAQRAFDALHPQIGIDGRNVSLRVGSRWNGRTDLTIEIPSGAAATIVAGHGDVVVNGVSAPLDVTAGNGDVKLAGVKAPSQVRMNKGDFSAHAMIGDLSLAGQMDDVAISDVEGSVLLNGDFFGDLRIARVTSQVHFRSSRTTMEIASLPGNLWLGSSDLQISNPAGPLRVTSKAKDIECSGVSGDATVENEDGEIALSVAGRPGTMRIEDRNGSINLTMPQNTSFALQAIAKDGEIHSEFDLPVKSLGNGNDLSGNVGSGGPTIELIADHGDIRIGRSNAASAASGSVAQGSKTIRHLRVPDGGAPLTQSQ